MYVCVVCNAGLIPVTSNRTSHHAAYPSTQTGKCLPVITVMYLRDNEWVLNKAGVNRELLDTVKARKLAYCGHATRKQGERDNVRCHRPMCDMLCIS